MNGQEFSRNLASSLTTGAWSKADLESCLQRRFPPALQRLAPLIALELQQAFTTKYAPPVKEVAEALRGIGSFRRAFSYCQRHNIWPAPDISPPRMAPTFAFTDLDIPQLPATGDLANWLVLSPERLGYFADPVSRAERHEEMAVNHYHYHLKPKKKQGLRVIEAPKQSLKTLQRQILRNIVQVLPPHENAFAFVTGRNCIQAANRHTGAPMVVRFDLKDFFPSLGAGRVFGLFRCLGYPHEVAQTLTALCTTATPPRILERLPYPQRGTYRSPHLPQGAPSSPALANHLCFGLDCRLSALARTVGADYSRYADDLTFSGDAGIVNTLLKAVPAIVRDEGLVINPAKTRVMPDSSRQVVTGLIVNDHLNVDRQSFDRLKAVIHACRNADDARLQDPGFRASLEGKIDWVTSVNPRRGQKLKQLLENALTN